MHEVMVPYQHCTVLHKIMHKIIADLVCFCVYSVMLMQQLSPVSFIVTTSNGAAGAGRDAPSSGRARQARDRRRDGRPNHYASCQICMTNTFLFNYLYESHINNLSSRGGIQDIQKRPHHGRIVERGVTDI